MEHKTKSPYTIIHLQSDEPLIQSIESFVKERYMQTTAVISGIGQLKNITLGYFKEKGNYMPKTFSEPHELLSLTGTFIVKKNIVYPHLHAVIGSENKQTFGGHLIDATVEVTNEIILLELPIRGSRKQSSKSGLMELDLSS